MFVPVHRLYSRQAQQTPDAPAVRSEGVQLTYRELDLRSNALALELVAGGVARDRIVGVCVERSVEMLVAFLGVLKAGGAFLYLDPVFHPTRLASMCAAAEARLVIASAAGAQALAGADVHRLSCTPGTAAAPPATMGDERSLAYVIYTSGSTGQGKAVGIEQRALREVTLGLRQAYDIRPTDRVLQFASPSWDTAIEEIFPTLLSGATLVLRSERMVESVEFLRGCAAESVSIVNLPTAFWHRLVGDLDDRHRLPRSVRTVIIGGEAVAADRVERWKRRTGAGPRLLNTYGLTEAAAVCTVGELHTPESPAPIGRPLPYVELSVRDEALREVPDEVVGELCVGGPGLARGYLNAPEEQTLRFVPHPEREGQRLYRTGDRGFRRPDGQFVCTGRLDQQLKVGGIRIELGEVEAVLRRHPGVREAVALAQPGGELHPLVAYVVAAGVSPAELRQLAREHLPPAVVPAIVLLDRLPLTTSGKVDRRALPALVSAAPPPVHGEGEQALTALAAEVLGLPDMAPTDDFFALGGHSLLATTLILRARRQLGLEIPFDLMLRHRTPREMYQATRARPPAPPPEEDPSRATENEGIPSIAQARHWRLHRVDPAGVAYNLTWILHLTGELTVQRIEHVLTELVRRHETLRTTFAEPPGEGLRAIVQPPAPVRVEVTEVTTGALLRAALSAMAIEDARKPFRLGAELPFRARWIRGTTRTSALLLTVHHVAVDGWSLSVLAREAAEIDRALVEGRSPRLPELPLRYCDYAAWQRRLVRSARGERQLAYWQERLQSGPMDLDLPHDRSGISARGGHLVRPWTREMSEALRRSAARLNATSFILFLTLLARALGAWSKRTDVLVGTPIANRSRLEFEPLVGLFLNALGLRLDLSGNPTFHELAERVRHTVIEAFSNADIPLEQVFEALGSGSAPRPWFPVMLVVQNTPPVRATFQGLEVEVEEVGPEMVFYDLVLIVKASDEGFGLEWQYNADHFSEERMIEIADRFDAMARSAFEGLLRQGGEGVA